MQAQAREAVRHLDTSARTAAARRASACSTRAGIRAWWAWSPAASRIDCGRPVVAFAPGGRGRAARIGAFDSRRAYPRRARCDRDAANRGLIERFGGHAMAAGLTLREDRISIASPRAFDAAVRTTLASQVASDDAVWTGWRTDRRATCRLATAQLLRDGWAVGAGLSGTVVRRRVRDRVQPHGRRRST